MTSFILYNRVAAAGQPERGASADAQLARCLEYIKTKGWVIVAEYVDHTQGDAR